jgi:hypothetical protein
MMIVPEAANMPPTPWQTQISASGIWAGAMPHIWRTLSLQRVHAVHAGMHVGEAAAIGVERDPRATGPAGRPGDAGGGVARGDEGSGLARGNGLSSPPRKRGSREQLQPNSSRFPLARE